MHNVKRRMTKQRSVILDILCNDHTHPTAEEVYMKTKEVLPDISLGTVYRNLNLLAEEHEIVKLDLGDDKVHFDGDMSNHHHFICKNCGKIIDIRIKENDTKALEEQVASENNLRIHSSQLVFNGICDDCIN